MCNILNDRLQRHFPLLPLPSSLLTRRRRRSRNVPCATSIGLSSGLPLLRWPFFRSASSSGPLQLSKKDDTNCCSCCRCCFDKFAWGFVGFVNIGRHSTKPRRFSECKRVHAHSKCTQPSQMSECTRTEKFAGNDSR